MVLINRIIFVTTCMMIFLVREGGQLVTSVVLERNGLPVMPTNRVIPVIQVSIIIMTDLNDVDNNDDY